MVNYPTILNLPQEDINRQLYEMIVKLQKENAGEDTDITAVEGDVSEEIMASRQLLTKVSK